MDEKCTCGAKLPSDALFCHRCGRPLREPPPVLEAEQEPEIEEPPPQIEPAAPAIQSPVAINFRNGTAVRVGLIAAALIQVGLMVSVPLGASMLAPVIHLAGGFYAVFLYKRRSGGEMNVLNGARMGWITGVFAFVLITIFFTASMALIAGSDQFTKAYEESARTMGLSPENGEKLMQLFRNPLFILAALAFQFLMLTLLCSLGGALGAKLQHKE